MQNNGRMIQNPLAVYCEDRKVKNTENNQNVGEIRWIYRDEQQRVSLYIQGLQNKKNTYYKGFEG